MVNVDFAALHDGSGPLLVRLMKERGYDKEPVFNAKHMLFANEFGPESTREVANEHALCRQVCSRTWMFLGRRRYRPCTCPRI